MDAHAALDIQKELQQVGGLAVCQPAGRKNKSSRSGVSACGAKATPNQQMLMRHGIELVVAAAQGA